ncbi:MAG: 3',5'-cyclic-nucleotide phosphodiesterase [Acidobacteria bacterium]|nr:3',5'-cyclic-nucleotide phosphodiesterase [Acidobacteriota bacterium]
MKIRILGTALEDTGRRQYASSYLINQTVAVDAGCLGLWGSPEQQERVRHVLLTHAHADHIASLPLFLETVWTPEPGCPVVYGSHASLETLRKHVFNDEVWPDFELLSERMPPFVRMRQTELETPFEVDGLQVTPVQVNHAVPTQGYVVREGDAAVIFGGDSGPTERLWKVARETPGLRAVFLEASFPNQWKAVAVASLHLTPAMFAEQAAQLPPEVRIFAIHLKVRYRDVLERELRALSLPNLEIAECERDYQF